LIRPTISCVVRMGGGGGTNVVHPLLSFVSMPFGDRIEMTFNLKYHSKAKKSKNPLSNSPTDYY
jgi:hypothetical protein